MKKIFKYILREEVLVILMVFLIVGLSFLTTFYEIFSFRELPEERVAVLEHNWTYDFNVYISKMTQGERGSWLVYNKYTSEPHGGSLLHIFYLLLGKIGLLFGLTMPATYLVARVILSFIIFYILYYLLCQLLKDKGLRLLAFFLSLFATQLPKFTPFSGKQGFDIGFWVPWWTGGDHLQEVSFLPHYMLGHILTLLMFLLFWRAGKGLMGWMKAGLWAGVLGMVAGIVHPPSLVVLYPAIIFWILWNLLRGKFSKDFLKSFLVFVGLSFSSLVYVFWATSRFPWKSLSTEVEFLGKISFLELAMTTGGVFFLGIAGLIVALWKKKEELYIFVFWIVSVIFLGFVVSRLGLYAQLRAFQTFHRIAFSVLSAYFLAFLVRSFKKFGLGLAGQMLAVLMVAILVIFSAVSMKRSIKGWIGFIDSRIHAGVPLVPAPPTIMYPLRDFMKGISFLAGNTEPWEVVLAGFTAGNYIPAYSGNTVYFGHNETVDYENKKALVKSFFGKKMSREEGENFLRENRIKYVFFGPQEKDLAKGEFYNWPIFEKRFESGYVEIYGVRI